MQAATRPPCVHASQGGVSIGHYERISKFDSAWSAGESWLGERGGGRVLTR